MWGRGVSQTRRPILCDSWKYRLVDWGSGHLLLLAGLYPQSSLSPLIPEYWEDSLMDEGLGMYPPWRCWYMNGLHKRRLQRASQPQGSPGHLTNSQGSRCLSEMKLWQAFLHMSLRSSSYVLEGSIRYLSRGQDSVLVKVWGGHRTCPVTYYVLVQVNSTPKSSTCLVSQVGTPRAPTPGLI